MIDDLFHEGQTGPAGEAERGVSNVIGVILMVALVVILAAVIGTYVLGIGSNQDEPAPTVSASTGETISTTDGEDEVVLVHDSGDPIDASNLKIVVQINGKTGRLVKLPVSGSLSGSNIRGDDIFDEGFNGVEDRSVLDTSGGDTDGTWSAGDVLQFELCCLPGTPSEGDEVDVQVIHTPSGSVIVEKTLTVSG